MLGVGQNIFDIFYPIGTYYETSDTNFNPNTAHGWYGTWVEDTQGQVLVSRNSGTFKTVGDNKGSESVILNQNQMATNTPAVRIVNSGEWSCGIWASHGTGYGINLPGQYSTSGQGQAHNNIQPSKVAIRWHRIA